jgi:hypothetical protein
LLTNTKYKYKCKNNVPMYKWGEGVKGLGRITISFEDIFFRKQLKENHQPAVSEKINNLGLAYKIIDKK